MRSHRVFLSASLFSTFSDGDVVMLIDHDNLDADDQPDTPARAGFTDGGTEVVCILLAVE